MDTITLTSVENLVIDLKAERNRINSTFNKKQSAVLLSAIDAFEVGNLQEMIDIMQNTKSKKLFDYPTWEYLSDVFYKVIQDHCLERKVWTLKK